MKFKSSKLKKKNQLTTIYNLPNNKSRPSLSVFLFFYINYTWTSKNFKASKSVGKKK